MEDFFDVNAKACMVELSTPVMEYEERGEIEGPGTSAPIFVMRADGDGPYLIDPKTLVGLHMVICKRHQFRAEDKVLVMDEFSHTMMNSKCNWGSWL